MKIFLSVLFIFLQYVGYSRWQEADWKSYNSGKAVVDATPYTCMLATVVSILYLVMFMGLNFIHFTDELNSDLSLFMAMLIGAILFELSLVIPLMVNYTYVSVLLKHGQINDRRFSSLIPLLALIVIIATGTALLKYNWSWVRQDRIVRVTERAKRKAAEINTSLPAEQPLESIGR
ncbi:MAG: hypothetical protein KKB51_11735 [Candidatus Riflebacteria bacterium]|nr:hypothetical protein [Candidatus Riflebacteria bacterium]